MNKWLCTALFSPCLSFAFEDPTQGKAFLPWLWEDQLRPTIEVAAEPSNLYLLAGGTALTAASFAYDEDDKAPRFSRHAITEDQAQVGSILGGGLPGIGVAVVQLFVDQDNGLLHGHKS